MAPGCTLGIRCKQSIVCSSDPAGTDNHACLAVVCDAVDVDGLDRPILLMVLFTELVY